MDAQTEEDVIRFVAENTYVDGGRLADVFPQIEDYIAQVQHEADTLGEKFNFDAIRIPRTLQYYNNYEDYSYADSSYDYMYTYEEEPTKIE